MQIRWRRTVKILNICLPKTQILMNELHGAQKLIFAKLVKFIEFYENQNFFAMFRTAHSRSWAKWNQSVNYPANCLKLVLILCAYLGLIYENQKRLYNLFFFIANANTLMKDGENFEYLPS